jgi:hypothetical protein
VAPSSPFPRAKPETQVSITPLVRPIPRPPSTALSGYVPAPRSATPASMAPDSWCGVRFPNCPSSRQRPDKGPTSLRPVSTHPPNVAGCSGCDCPLPVPAVPRVPYSSRSLEKLRFHPTGRHHHSTASHFPLKRQQLSPQLNHRFLHHPEDRPGTNILDPGAWSGPGRLPVREPLRPGSPSRRLPIPPPGCGVPGHRTPAARPTPPPCHATLKSR